MNPRSRRLDLKPTPGHARTLRRLRGGRVSLDYDTLVVAGGSHYSYIGHDEWHHYAPELIDEMARALDGKSEPLPGLAPVAIQEGRRRGAPTPSMPSGT